MARVRGSPRQAGRHTGNLYNEGRQYELASYRKLNFGPFAYVRPDVEDEREILQILRSVEVESGEGLAGIRNGRPVPLTYKPDAYPHIANDIGTTSDKILGMGSTYIKSEPYRVYFVKDAVTDNLMVQIYDSAGTVTEVDTGYDSNDMPVKHVFWGDNLFFLQQGFARLFHVDFVAKSLTSTYSTTAALWFLFVLDNNLCVVAQDSTHQPVLYWHSDGGVPPGAVAPSGLYNAGPFAIAPGAGSYVVNAQMGEVTGVGIYNNTALVNCKNGAFTMTPTGTLPAFRFAGGDYLPGTRAVNATTGGSSGVVYVGNDGYVYAFQGGQPERVGKNPPRFDVMSTTRVVFSQTLNAWFVWYVPPDGVDVRLWILDAASFDFISYTDLPYEARNLTVLEEMSYQESTAGAGDDFDALVMFSEYGGQYNVLIQIPYGKDYGGTGGSAFAQVRAESHFLNLGGPARVLYADVALRAQDAKLLVGGDLTLFFTVRAVTGMDAPEEGVYTAVNQDADVVVFRFPINKVGDLVNFSLVCGADSHPWYAQPTQVTFVVEGVDHIHESMMNL